MEHINGNGANGFVGISTGVSEMSALSDLSANLQAQSDYNRVDFLLTELVLCFTFSIISARKYEAGNQESAAKSMANAERAYETVLHFLSDTKYSKHLTDETIQECTAALGRLRDRLDGLQRGSGK
jgi:hypothetical protein